MGNFISSAKKVKKEVDKYYKETVENNVATGSNVKIRGFAPQTIMDRFTGTYTGLLFEEPRAIGDDQFHGAENFRLPLVRKDRERFKEDLERERLWGIYYIRLDDAERLKSRRARHIQDTRRICGLPDREYEDMNFLVHDCKEDKDGFTIQPYLEPGYCIQCYSDMSKWTLCPAVSFLEGVNSFEELIKIDLVRLQLKGLPTSGIAEFVVHQKAAEQVYILRASRYESDVDMGGSERLPMIIREAIIGLQFYKDKRDMYGKMFFYEYKRGNFGCHIKKLSSMHGMKVSHAVAMKL